MDMSPGMTAYQFVQQVYYAQEKTILDFWPTDDKYREVLFEANFILQELQNAEDWTWLRSTLILGSCETDDHSIPVFELSEDIYKPSTLNHDCLYLMPESVLSELADGIDWVTANHPNSTIVQTHFPWWSQWWWWNRGVIRVPIASTGDIKYRRPRQITGFGMIHTINPELRAIRIGNQITFNRKLTYHESKLIAVMDVQERIEQFHVCDEFCTYVTLANSRKVCSTEVGELGEIKHLKTIPDPNYVVMATAARHAEGSPPALARVSGLQDAAQRILSAMRQNDAAATDADYQDWEIPGYVEVI